MTRVEVEVRRMLRTFVGVRSDPGVGGSGREDGIIPSEIVGDPMSVKSNAEKIIMTTQIQKLVFKNDKHKHVYSTCPWNYTTVATVHCSCVRVCSS